MLNQVKFLANKKPYYLYKRLMEKNIKLIIAKLAQQALSKFIKTITFNVNRLKKAHTILAKPSMQLIKCTNDDVGAH